MTSGPYSIGSDVLPGLSKIIEEFGEALQIAGKLIATGGASEHYDRNLDLMASLVEELADATAAMQFFREHSFTSQQDQDFWNRVVVKTNKFNQWHHTNKSPEWSRRQDRPAGAGSFDKFGLVD